MKINKQDFISWKNHEVTKEFYKVLEELKDQIEEQMLNDGIISATNGHLALNRLAGIREGINQVLFISVEDMDNESED